MNELTSVRDEQTMTQYVYGLKGMVSYDDKRAICDKTEYAQVHDLNGYIIWELSGDLMPDLTTPLLDAANAKLLDPTLDCASLDASNYIGIEAAIEGGTTIEAEVANLYYPNSDSATCLNDGLEAEWILDKDKYSSLTACCMAHFSWNNDCVSSGELADAVAELEDQTGVIWYSSTTAPECLSGGNQPSYYDLDSLHSTAEACCNVHYTGSYYDCIARSYAAASSSGSTSDADNVLPLPVATPTVAETSVEESIMQVTDKFFPVFGDDGTTRCMTGMPPSWMSINDMKATKGDCCHSYTLSYNNNECLSNPYYPIFKDQKCLNDGNHPAWMAGDYLFYSQEKCSSIFEAISSSVVEEERPEDNSQSQAEVQSTTTTTTTTSTISNDPIIGDIPQEITSSLGAAAVVESVLESHIDILDNGILVYETPEMDWKPSPVYQSRDMIEAIRIMSTEGLANKFFYTGDDSDNGHVYGLVNVASFLAQAMKETIKYNACDENSWDAVGGGYPLSNACGQLGQSYQDYHCSEAEKHMECPVDKNMEITATTGAKWW